jgi:hypothetical protein
MAAKVSARQRTGRAKPDQGGARNAPLSPRMPRVAILLYIGGMGGLLLVMARGFKWL